MLKMFLTGAAVYPVLELVYRRRTHWTMSIAGGVSGVVLSIAGKLKLPLLTKVFLSGIGITGVELICGLLWNRRHQIWDYRHLPFQYKGQVCLPFTLLWCGMSLLILPWMKK